RRPRASAPRRMDRLPRPRVRLPLRGIPSARARVAVAGRPRGADHAGAAARGLPRRALGKAVESRVPRAGRTASLPSVAVPHRGDGGDSRRVPRLRARPRAGDHGSGARRLRAPHPLLPRTGDRDPDRARAADAPARGGPRRQFDRTSRRGARPPLCAARRGGTRGPPVPSPVHRSRRATAAGRTGRRERSLIMLATLGLENVFGLALWLTGIANFCVLGAGAQVPVRFGWRSELARLSPMNRKLMWVYYGFIGTTIVAFGL